MNKERGITLIALIITIIVMLILAAVTINVVLNGGLFEQAKNAKMSTEDAAAREQAQMIVAAAKMASIADKNLSFEDALKKGLEGQNNFNLEDGNILVDENTGNSYTVIEDYTIAQIGKPKQEWAENVGSVVEGVPIPKGFYYVGGTKSKGIVISDNKADMNKGDSHTVATTLQGNQFVWIPVDKPESMYFTDTSGKRFGRLYTIYLYGGAGSFHSTTDGALAGNIISGFYSQGFAEPVRVDSDMVVSNVERAGYTYTNANSSDIEFQKYLQDDFDVMIDSVINYKGFYIGRYETSANGGVAQSKQGKEPIRNTTDGYDWYDMYKIQKDMYKSSNNVGSTMVWGSAWDQIMLWMKDIKNPNTGGKFIYDTVGMRWAEGVHSGFSGNMTGTPLTEAVLNKVNNIYDLAGSVEEYTVEGFGNSKRVVRGGELFSGFINTTEGAVSYRGVQNDPTNKYASVVGSRLQLYIK